MSGGGRRLLVRKLQEHTHTNTQQCAVSSTRIPSDTHTHLSHSLTHTVSHTHTHTHTHTLLVSWGPGWVWTIKEPVGLLSLKGLNNLNIWDQLLLNKVTSSATHWVPVNSFGCQMRLKERIGEGRAPWRAGG